MCFSKKTRVFLSCGRGLTVQFSFFFAQWWNFLAGHLFSHRRVAKISGTNVSGSDENQYKALRGSPQIWDLRVALALSSTGPNLIKLLGAYLGASGIKHQFWCIYWIIYVFVLKIWEKAQAFKIWQNANISSVIHFQTKMCKKDPI